MRRMIAVALGGVGLFSLAALAGAASWDNPPKRRVEGLEHRTFRSPSMKVSVGFNICLPPGYGDEKKRFPVIYYLHGYDGNESSYLEYAKYWRESLSRSGASILVFLNGGERSFFCDAPDGSLNGETVVRELVAHVDATCRTVPERDSRALHGYSMGGFGALKLAFKYPELFGTVVAYGATLCTANEMQKHLPKVYEKAFGRDKGRFEANHPETLLERNGNDIQHRTRVRLVIGSKDQFLPANRQLFRRLQMREVRATLDEIPAAGHDKDAIYDRAAYNAFVFTLEDSADAAQRRK